MKYRFLIIDGGSEVYGTNSVTDARNAAADDDNVVVDAEEGVVFLDASDDNDADVYEFQAPEAPEVSNEDEGEDD